ncbi:ABC-type Fe3+-hydroxamate transport system, periplasmic component [Beggiatoa alba B18LD]|uniref:ABC-type Fe3+-hydroxamate transport system, periplasmic component n=1 Tax=Beggiatoa alba B18LD TaxID=395493 RepID=I3CI28_9GAMM|nr:ABC transporter substrate-binding protein [Beggiatoa alba]EIJ43271.1 ABC-type Fe3+-hydroxamate transport system, periplasmic component [Beggiatoa alba B18LD]
MQYLPFFRCYLILCLYFLSVTIHAEPLNIPVVETMVEQAQFPRQIEDEQGKIVQIPRYPQRIVSQTLATDEILLALTIPSRLIALSGLAQDPRYSLISETAQQMLVPLAGNAEQILSLQPDLVFIASYNRAEMVALLETSHIPLIRFSRFDSIEDIQQHIRVIGMAIGADVQATTLIAEMNQRLNAVKSRIPAGKPLRVLSYDLEGYSAGKGTTFDNMLQYVNAINVLTEQGIQGHTKISIENLALWQPDVIISGTSADKIEQTRQQLQDNILIAQTKAGQSGQIIVLDNRYLLSVSHHIVTGVEQLAQALYPAVHE